jgi:hypothetical protein
MFHRILWHMFYGEWSLTGWIVLAVLAWLNVALSWSSGMGPSFFLLMAIFSSIIAIDLLFARFSRTREGPIRTFVRTWLE